MEILDMAASLCQESIMETVRKYLEDGDGVVDVGEFRMDSDTDGEIDPLPLGGLVGMNTGV